MNHDACSIEAEYLRKSLAETKSSREEISKQLRIAKATAEFALKAGENAARQADQTINKLNDIISQLMKVIGELTRDMNDIEKSSLRKIYPVLDGASIR